MAQFSSAISSRASLAKRRADTWPAIESEPFALPQNQKVSNNLPVELWNSILPYLILSRQSQSQIKIHPFESKMNPMNNLAMTCFSLHSSLFSTRIYRLTLHDGALSADLPKKIRFFKNNPIICEAIHTLIISFSNSAGTNRIHVSSQFQLLLPVLKHVKHFEVRNFDQGSLVPCDIKPERCWC